MRKPNRFGRDGNRWLRLSRLDKGLNELTCMVAVEFRRHKTSCPACGRMMKVVFKNSWVVNDKRGIPHHLEGDAWTLSCPTCHLPAARAKLRRLAGLPPLGEGENKDALV